MATALPTTLRSVTKTKIVELKKQRDLYESLRAAIEQSVNKHGKQLDKIESLLRGSFRIEGISVPDEDSNPKSEDGSKRSGAGQKLSNYWKLLKQARVDHSFPPAALHRIQQDLIKDLERKSLQHQHAQFYSELVTEWISDANEVPQLNTTANEVGLSTSKFENVGRKEMHEQRAQWESIVFSDPPINTMTVSAYLEKLFNSREANQKAFEKMEKNIATFCQDLRVREVFTSESVKLAIKSLLASDLLSDDKRATLKTFLTNKAVIKEVADVLQMRFSSLETWQWTTVDNAIIVEQRRQLNGKYRVYMDEDVLDALLLHQIGMEWAALLKSEFTKFFLSFAWKRAGDTVPVEARARREWFLGKDKPNGGKLVPDYREENYASEYFMNQLPKKVEEGIRRYGDGEDGEDGEEDEDDQPESGSRMTSQETKQGLLHLLITEALVARNLRPGQAYSIIRSDYKWFGPSLPHPTIFKVLEFFGVDAFWRSFIRKFLQAPTRFIQDGPKGEVRVRTRGVPMSHPLSDVLSEAVLFVGDFAINQATKLNLYRLHDDFWFWGPYDVCHRAWQEMSAFASIMGLAFNEEKTGSVTFPPFVTLRQGGQGYDDNNPYADKSDNRDDNDDSDDEEEEEVVVVVEEEEEEAINSSNYPGLPKGEVRWGFLKLNRKTVRFEVDQKMVDEHIKELKLQLDSCGSIFGYVQAYNSYASRFFTNNMCPPCYAFGRQHIDAMIATLDYIQRSLFPTGRVTDHLNSVASSRFAVMNADASATIPEGFWYMPISMGGLGLHNPVIPLLEMRESMRETPARILEVAMEHDEALYLKAREHYENNNTGTGLGSSSQKQEIGDHKHFMPKDEYMRYREERSCSLARAYQHLMSTPLQRHGIDPSPEIEALFSLGSSFSSYSEGSGRKRELGLDQNDPYWRRIVAVHGPEIVDRYGSLQMVDPGQVPLGVVGVMKAGKIRWRG